jgi:hypothetical protein
MHPGISCCFAGYAGFFDGAIFSEFNTRLQAAVLK